MDPAVQAALTGGLVSTAGDLLGAGLSFGLGQAAAGQQWDKWKDSQTRGPLYRLIGLEEAGLNPILAAKGGLGGGGGGFTPTAVASGGGGLPLGSNATRAAKEIGLMRDQARGLRAARERDLAQTGLNRSATGVNQVLRRLRKWEADAAETRARITDIDHLVRQSTGAAEIMRAKRQLIEESAWKQVWEWMDQNPAVLGGKYIFGNPVSAATDVMREAGRLGSKTETVMEDRWSEDHRTGDVRTSGSKRTTTRGRKPRLNKLFRR